MAEQVTPSRMYILLILRTLQIYKQKNISAKKGHELLKKKCDALKTKIRIVLLNKTDCYSTFGC